MPWCNWLLFESLFFSLSFLNMISFYSEIFQQKGARPIPTGQNNAMQMASVQQRSSSQTKGTKSFFCFLLPLLIKLCGYLSVLTVMSFLFLFSTFHDFQILLSWIVWLRSPVDKNNQLLKIIKSHLSRKTHHLDNWV